MSIWREVSAWASPFLVRTEKSELPWIRPSSFHVLCPCLTRTTLFADFIGGNGAEVYSSELSSLSWTLEEERITKLRFGLVVVGRGTRRLWRRRGGAIETICNCSGLSVFFFFFPSSSFFYMVRALIRWEFLTVKYCMVTVVSSWSKRNQKKKLIEEEGEVGHRQTDTCLILKRFILGENTIFHLETTR